MTSATRRCPGSPRPIGSPPGADLLRGVGRELDRVEAGREGRKAPVRLGVHAREGEAVAALVVPLAQKLMRSESRPITSPSL